MANVTSSLNLVAKELTKTATYSGTCVLLALTWNVLWHPCSSNYRLLGKHVGEADAREIIREYYVAPFSFTPAFLVALISGVGCAVVIILVAA
jgi:hypothetical protein